MKQRIEGFLNIENKSNNDKKSYEILGVFNLVQSKEYKWSKDFIKLLEYFLSDVSVFIISLVSLVL